MTQDEIIEMAREADLDWHTGWTLDDEAPNRFEAFAKLVAAKEREACAKVCDDDDSNAGEWHWEAHVGGYFARAIRARGEQA